MTSRLSNYSNAVTLLPVQVLSETAASEFLLHRTDSKRRRQANDPQQAEALARELDGLPLALEQAGAYIARRRLTLENYLQQWSQQRDKLLVWSDPRLMNYPKRCFCHLANLVRPAERTGPAIIATPCLAESGAGSGSAAGRADTQCCR